MSVIMLRYRTIIIFLWFSPFPTTVVSGIQWYGLVDESSDVFKGDMGLCSAPLATWKKFLSFVLFGLFVSNFESLMTHSISEPEVLTFFLASWSSKGHWVLSVESSVIGPSEWLQCQCRWHDSTYECHWSRRQCCRCRCRTASHVNRQVSLWRTTWSDIACWVRHHLRRSTNTNTPLTPTRWERPPPPWSTTILVHGGRFRSLARPSSNIFVIYHTFIRVSSAIKCPKTSYYYWRPGTSLGSLQRSQTQLLICWEKIKMLAYLRALSVIILSQEPCLSLYTGPSTCACNTVYMY